MIAFALEDMVEELGYQVVGPAHRLADALTLAERETIDGAVLDVNLNDEPSFPVADLLLSRGIPFVFATGYAEGGLAWSGDVTIIAKPYGRDQLSRALADLFD